jgi:hypothetical protein
MAMQMFSTCLGMSKSFVFIGRLALVTALTMVIAGCSQLDGVVSKWNITDPEPTSTSMSTALACLGREIRTAQSNGKKFPRVVLVVDEVADETRSPRDPYTGKLSYGGRKVVETVIDREIPRDFIVIYAIPQAVTKYNVSGELGASQMKELEALRKQHRADFLLLLNVGFTKSDDAVSSDGLSGSGTYEGGKLNTSITGGTSQRMGRIGLHGKLGSPFGNLRVHSFGLDIETTSKSKRFMLNLGYDMAGLGLEAENLLVDGPHGAQDVLLVAAAYHVVSFLAEGHGHERCIAVQSQGRQAFSRWQTMSEQERVKVVQRGLARKRLYEGRIDGVWGAALQRAVDRFAAEQRTMSYGPQSISSLHIAMLVAGLMDE